jgi:hypothetical protein
MISGARSRAMWVAAAAALEVVTGAGLVVVPCLCGGGFPEGFGGRLKMCTIMLALSDVTGAGLYVRVAHE